VSGFQPMLASPGQPEQIAAFQASGQWLWDTKWDGVRAIVVAEGGHVRLRNRRGADISARYPDLTSALAALLTDVVVDGELVVLRGGRPDFAAIHRRDAQQGDFSIRLAARQFPATLIAFDLLAEGGRDLRGQPLEVRLGRLDELAAAWPADGPVRRSVVCEDGVALWAQVRALGLEGVVAKRRGSRYVGRRSPAWCKFKTTSRLTAIAIGYEPGQGARAGKVGALKLVLVAPDASLLLVGKVGSGLTEADLAVCKQTLDAGVPLVVEVEALSVSRDGKLRNPAFKGVRSDVEPAACVSSQLDELPVT